MESSCTYSAQDSISRSIFKCFSAFLILLMLLPLTVFSQKKKKDELKIKQWKKVTICHKGKTIEINENALQAHLNHGDALGPCEVSQDFDGIVVPYLEYIGKVVDPIGPELTALTKSFEVYGSAASDEIFVISERSLVLIEIITQRNQKPAVISFLQSTYGITEFVDDDNDLLVTVLFPIDKLPELNYKDDIIRYVTPVYPAITNSGIVTSLGDVAQQSDNARNAFGVDGEGITLGVLSDSYNVKGQATNDILNGDLPGASNPEGNITPVIVLKEYPSESVGSIFSTVDEGRAMLHIIHDVAPNATLAFRTGVVTAGDMASGIYDLKNIANCDIIVDDITHFKDPFFQDGVIAQAVNDVTTAGVQYFTSAGNFGINSYEAQFNPSATYAGNHDFNLGNAGEDVMQHITMGVGFFRIVLQWDDNYYTLPGATDTLGAQNDFDIYIINDAGDTLVNNNSDNLGKDPIEIMTFYVMDTFATSNIVIHRASGTEDVKLKYIVFEGKDFLFKEHAAGSSTITGHANSAGAMTVGAVLYYKTPAFDSIPSIASFSSRGGLLVNGSDRQKPDFTAPNGANTNVDLNGYDIDSDIYPNFFGTSASAPHAAAVAALLLNAQSKFGEDFDVRQLLKQTAIDMEAPGFDNASGSGFILADAAMLTFAAPKPTITELVVPPGATPGVTAFDLTINGKNLHQNTKIRLAGVELATESTVINSSTQLTVEIPIFIGDSSIQAITSPISYLAVDGGTSETLYLLRAPKKIITVTAHDKTKKYGQRIPIFTTSVTVDGVPLDSTNLTLEELGLNNLTFQSPATSLSIVGLSIINPVSPPGEISSSMLELYNYEFNHGNLVTEKASLTITPNDLTKVYGEKISDITYLFELDSTNIDPLDYEIILDNIALSYSSTFVDDSIIAVVDRFRGVVNRYRGVVNGTGWLITPLILNRFRGVVNGNSFIDIPPELFETYIEDPSDAFTNRFRGIVNGGIFAAGEATINRFRGIVNDGDDLIDRFRGVVNDGGLANSDGGVVGFDSLIVIVDSLDHYVSTLFSINLVSGLDVTTEDNLHYIVPGGYFALESEHFEITYGLGNLRILPATLTVAVDDKMILNGDPLPNFTATITGFVYEETAETVFSSITYEPTTYSGSGVYPIIPTFTFADEINYTLEPLAPQGVLTTVTDVGYLVSTNDGLKLLDNVGNITNHINSTSRSVEVFDNHIYLLGTQQNIEEYNLQGELLRSISIPPEAVYYLTFTVLPNTNFALYDNLNDKIYFIDSQGSYLATVDMLNPSTTTLQNIDGVVVDNFLVVSENGNNQLLQVDLSNYQSVIFKDLTHLTGWLSAIDYNNGTYYLCQSTKIWSFIEGGGTETLISTLPEGNITSIVVAGNYAYATINFTNRVYKVDISSGVYEIFAEGLLYAQDIEMLPLVPAPQPVNGQIAIAPFNADGDTDLVLVNSDGSNPVILVGGPEFVRDPQFSLDGTQIVFTLSNVIAGGQRNLWKINTDGTGITQLTSNDYSQLGVFSPDGTKIAFIQNNEVALMNADGTGAYDLTRISNSRLWPTFSPDGHELYYTQFNSGYNDIWKVDINTNAFTKITSDLVFHRSPELLKDGSKIIYTRAAQSGASGDAIMSMNLDGSGQTVIYSGNVSHASVSPDNTMLAFIGPGVDLHTMNIDGTNMTNIYSLGTNVLQPSWGTNPDEPGTEGASILAESTLTVGEISIYPNPVIDIMNIAHADETVTGADIQVVVYDGSMTVQKVTTVWNSVLNIMEVDMTGLPAGYYIVNVNARGVTEQFTVQKN